MRCRVPVLSPYRTYGSLGYRYWGRTEITEGSGTSVEVVPNLSACIEVIPNLSGVCSRLLRLYRTLSKTLVGRLPSEYPRYALVCTLPNTAPFLGIPGTAVTQRKYRALTVSSIFMENRRIGRCRWSRKATIPRSSRQTRTQSQAIHPAPRVSCPITARTSWGLTIGPYQAHA